jgi:hypothetical protein
MKESLSLKMSMVKYMAVPVDELTQKFLSKPVRSLLSCNSQLASFCVLQQIINL